MIGIPAAWKEPGGRLEGGGIPVRVHAQEVLMLNNTSPQRWDRISAKSIDTQFSNAMQHGLNCSPFEAQIMVEKVHELYGPLFDTSTSTQPGQVQTVVVDASVAAGVALAQASQKLVTVTLVHPEDVETQRTQGVPGLRQKRLCRVCEEAFQQGGLFTLEDLTVLFNCGLRTLVGDLADLRNKHIVPPLRSTVKDIGRALTHRRLIITLWLEGKEYSDIAFRTHHTVASVANYVDKFKRSALLLQQGFDVATTAFLVRLSTLLVQQFHQLWVDARPVPHRQKEIEQWVKKSQALGQSAALGRRS
jgi:hypothetical protein